jgi:hypothetical protein
MKKNKREASSFSKAGRESTHAQLSIAEEPVPEEEAKQQETTNQLYLKESETVNNMRPLK